MAQEIINTGTTANDGTGDPLRTAFIKTDSNFDQIWAAGPVGTNVQISGNTISTVQVNQDLVLAPNGVANVRINNNTVPNANNIWYLGSATNRWRGAYIGSAGLSVDGNVTITGNLSAGNISYTSNVFVGDLQGSVFADDSTLIVDAINNAIYADEGYLGTVSASGNITANYFVGNGSLLTGIASTYGNANVADFLPTYGGNLLANTVEFTGELLVARRIVVGTLPSGNIEILDDTSGNGPALKTPGGSGLDLLIEPSGNLYLSADGGEVIVSDQSPSVDTSTGAFKVLGGIGVNGNINAGGNISASGWTGNLIPSANAVYSLGNATNYWSNLWVANNTIYIGGVPLGITAGNVLTVNGEAVLSNDSNATITTTGNITADYFFGNGSQLTGLSTSSISNGTSNVEIATANGNVAINTDSNTWTFGTDGVLTTPSNILLNGDITSNTGTLTLQSANNGNAYLQLDDTGDSYLGAAANLSLLTDADNREWIFDTTGTLTTPGDITVGGDITGTAGANTLVVKAQPTTDTYIQLNSIVDSTVSIFANLDIVTDSSNTAQTFIFDVAGDLTVPGNITVAHKISIGTNPGGNIEIVDDTAFNGPGIRTPGGSGLDLLIEPSGNLILSADGGEVVVQDQTDSTSSTTGALRILGGLGVAGNINAGNNITATGNIVTDWLNIGNIGNTSTLEADVSLQIVADAGGSAPYWQFNSDGNLYVPGNINGDNNGPLVIDGAGAGAAYISLPHSTFGSEQIAIVSNFPLGAGIRLETPGGNLVFDESGDLTAPGNVTATGNVSGANIITGNGANIVLGNSASYIKQQASNATINLGGSITLTPDTSASATNGVVIGGSGYLLAPNGSRNAVLNYGGGSGTMGIYTVNIYGNAATAIVNGGTSGVGNIGANASNRFNTAFLTQVDASGNITAGNIVTTGNVVGNVAGYSIGYRDIPQVSFTGNATIAAADAGRHFYSTESTDYILTIADNSAVSWPVGTAITVVNRGTGNITVAQASGVSLYLAGNSSAGNRTVSTYGMATLLNVAANVWMINGTGVA